MNAPVLELGALADAVAESRRLGKKIVLANGVFDLLHVGHVRYLQGAKAFGDVLVVAVNSDASTRRYKGPDRPYVPQNERSEMVSALRVVDFVHVFDGDDVREIIRMLKPDFQVKGTDYTVETIPERDEVLAYGGQVAVAGDAKDHSTTDVLRSLQKTR